MHIRAIRFLFQAHLPAPHCRLRRHLLRHAHHHGHHVSPPVDGAVHLPCFGKFLRRNPCHAAHCLVVRRLPSVEQTLHEPLCGGNVFPCKCSLAFLHVGRCASAKFVERIDAVRHGVCTHGHHCAVYMPFIVWFAHDVHRSRNLLIGKFLGEVLYADYLLFAVRRSCRAVESEVSVHTHLDGHSLHLHRCSPERTAVGHIGCRYVVISFQPLCQLFVLVSHSALHERRCQVGMYPRVRPAFCHHGLAHIPYGVYIKVWHCPDQSVRPVASRKGYLLFRREL